MEHISEEQGRYQGKREGRFLRACSDQHLLTMKIQKEQKQSLHPKILWK